MFIFGLIFKRLLPLLLLAAIVGGGIYAWRELHTAQAASMQSALTSVRDADLARGRAVLPLAGVYTYKATGEEQLGVGPLEIARDLPAEALLVVLPSADGGRKFEWQLSDSSTERWDLADGSKGSDLVYRSGEIDALRVSRTFGGTTTPVLWRPENPRAGMTWTVTYRAGGDVAAKRRSTVVKQESVKVGDQTVRTWVIRSTETFAGAVTGEERETVWWSPQLELDVRRTISRRVGGTVEHKLDADLQLTSVAPER